MTKIKKNDDISQFAKFCDLETPESVGKQKIKPLNSVLFQKISI